MTPEAWTLYCDEAGNAGANYLDAEQPFHVSAGWLIKPSIHADFVRAVSAAAGETQAPQLKGNTLLKKPNGQATVARLFEALAHLGCLPFFIVGERRFCVAGKAVEVYFDPYTNPAAEWLPTVAIEDRNRLWEIVSDLPDAVLEPFARAYAKPTPNGLRGALKPIVDALRAGGHDRIAATFAEAERHMEGIFEEEHHTRDGFEHWQWAALNVPIFLHVVKKVDIRVGAHPGEVASVIHHEIRSFDAAFAAALTRLHVPRHVPIDLRTPGGNSIRMGLHNVTGFSVAPSISTPGIQAADLLASTVARLMHETHVGRPWSEGLHRLAQLTLPALLHEQPINAGMLAHQRTVVKMLAPLFRR